MKLKFKITSITLVTEPGSGREEKLVVQAQGGEHGTCSLILPASQAPVLRVGTYAVLDTEPGD